MGIPEARARGRGRVAKVVYLAPLRRINIKQPSKGVFLLSVAPDEDVPVGTRPDASLPHRARFDVAVSSITYVQLLIAFSNNLNCMNVIED